LCLLLGIACNVESPETHGTGTDVEVTAGCGRGIVVVESDYQSTNVSLLGFDGRVLSKSFISPLSGDVTLPAVVSGDDIVLIDRYPAAVVTWANVRTAEVRTQLSVATGFASNPHDYLELSETRGLLTRFGDNGDPGRESFDQGSDALLIDSRSPKINGSIALGRTSRGDSEALSRPDRAVLVGERAYVLLGGYSRDFSDAAPSELAVIEPERETVEQTLSLDPLKGCSALAVSPDESELVAACAGSFDGDSVSSFVDSGLVRVRLPSLEVIRVYAASELGENPVGWGVDYTSERGLLVVTWGTLEGSGAFEPDRAYHVDLETGEGAEVLRTSDTAFALGEARCVPNCGACFVADAERAVTHRFEINDRGELGSPEEIPVDARIGLPPRYLGRF
jgi:hypothetical protein